MPFEIIWTNRARKDLRLIDKGIAGRIFNKIEEFNQKETVFLEKIKGKDFFKLRIGSYRVFIDKFPATGKLIVLHVKHRQSAYNKI